MYELTAQLEEKMNRQIGQLEANLNQQLEEKMNRQIGQLEANLNQQLEAQMNRMSQQINHVEERLKLRIDNKVANFE